MSEDINSILQAVVQSMGDDEGLTAKESAEVERRVERAIKSLPEEVRRVRSMGWTDAGIYHYDPEDKEIPWKIHRAVCERLMDRINICPKLHAYVYVHDDYDAPRKWGQPYLLVDFSRMYGGRRRHR